MLKDSDRMNFPLSVNNPYALLALFLSPWKCRETVNALANVIRQNTIDWGSLLYMANLHFCAPLWFVRLQQDGLLSLLPLDLQTYLDHLHQANAERQETFRQAAIEIVSNLHDLEVPVILLKGVATLCDDLYADPGARMMGDMDFLVQKQHIQAVKNLLAHLGYDEQVDSFGPPGYFNSSSPHHLPRYLKTGTPVAVEIHFQTAKGHADRVLSNDLSWANKEIMNWMSLTPWVLAPTYRLLHNAVHALVPNQAFSTSILSLGQLAEFAYLARRYASVIDWRVWWQTGAARGMSRQLRIYLTLAHQLMGMPYPENVPGVLLAGMHVARITGAANNRADYLCGHEVPPESAAERIKAVAVRIYTVVFQRLNRPVWIWRNLCYRKGVLHLPRRLFWWLVFTGRRIEFKKTLNMATISRKFNKMKSLLKKPELP
jgi:hypothetical protein